MPIKLASEAHFSEDSKFISRKTVIQMVKYYRANRTLHDGSSLKFAHFNAVEVIGLLSSNGIIPALTDAQKAAIQDYGVKVYMANHADDTTTCPVGRGNYKMNDTVILCTTQLKLIGGAATWDDLLTDGVSYVSMPGANDTVAATGLDKGTICPPDCPGVADPNGYQSVDIGNAAS